MDVRSARLHFCIFPQILFPFSSRYAVLLNLAPLLISFIFKVVVLFKAGKRDEAISRINDLVTDWWADPALYTVQACEKYRGIR